MCFQGISKVILYKVFPFYEITAKLFSLTYGRTSFLGFENIFKNRAQERTWNTEKEMSAWQIVILPQEEQFTSTLILPGKKVSLAKTTEVFLKFLCFELCLWEPFISVTCFTSAIFSQVPKTLQLAQVKDKELRSVVNKGSSQHWVSFFLPLRTSSKFSFESSLIA